MNKPSDDQLVRELQKGSIEAFDAIYIGQTRNLAFEKPDKLREMIERFEQIRGTSFQNIEQLELK